MEKTNIEPLEELKQQFTILTDRLDSQSINNERLLQIVIRTRMTWVNKYIYVKLFILFPCIIALYHFFYQTHKVSLPFYLSTAGMAILEIFIDIIINRVGRKGWLHQDLLTSRQILVRMNRNRSIQMVSSILILSLWASFFGLECIKYGLIDNSQPVIIATIIGGGTIIGLSLGALIYRKMQRTNDKLIQEIDKLVE